jgi:hypothetical protein
MTTGMTDASSISYRSSLLDLRQQAPRRSGAFIKVKRVATNLSTRHLRQVETYAVNEGVEHIILTNGSVWRVYHLTRESLKKRQIDESWKARRATSPTSLAQVLTSDPVAEAIRRELWRQTGHRPRYGRDCDEDIRSDEVAGFHSHALLMRCSRHPGLAVAVRPTIASRTPEPVSSRY